MRRRSDRLLFRWSFLPILAACAAACGEEPAPGSGRPSAAPEPPASPTSIEAGLQVTGVDPEAEGAYRRVVLVTIDTLRADHLASYGYFRATSPFLDRLAREGVLFERAMSASSHTAPSHASMFTGLVPGLHGLATNGARLAPEVATLAEAYRTAGYRTGAFASVAFLEGVASGFEDVRAQTSTARAVTNAAVSWLRRGAGEGPFLLWAHYYEPHRWKMPERVPAEHAQALARATTVGPEEAYAEVARLHGLPLPFPEGGMEWRSGDRGDEDIAPGTVAEVLAHVDSYDAQITYADAEIERLFAAVRQLEEEQGGATLWVVTSDHGEGLGSHDYAGHGWQIYQEQLRVPLIVFSSDASLAPRRVPDLVSTTDLFPTLVELLGGRVEGPLAEHAGRSLVRLLRGDGALAPRPVFSQRRPLRTSGGDGVYALQDERAKVILRLTGDDELYDLAADPLERSPSDPGGAPGGEPARLLTELEAWLRLIAERGGAAQEGDEAWLDELQKLGYAR